MGRPPSIDRDVAVKTALEIIDSEGLGALSMRRLAGDLGVNVAALYGYFENKDDLLRSVDALIFSETPVPDGSSDDWQAIVMNIALECYRVLGRHPNALPIFVQFPSRMAMSRLFDQFAELIVRRDVPREMIDALVDAFEILLIGSATLAFTRDVDGGKSRSPRRRGDRATQAASVQRGEDQFMFMCRVLVNGFAASFERSS